jgi:catechol 2,3-dioxygenase-like lactoylglutathione lyase family enzyme
VLILQSLVPQLIVAQYCVARRPDPRKPAMNRPQTNLKPAGSIWRRTAVRRTWLACAALACALVFSVGAAAAAPDGAAADAAHVVGLAFVGRVVANLDQAVAFYQAAGFQRDPAADPAWRKDPVVEQLYDVQGIETRMAKMYVINQDSGQHFVVYLRELRGLERHNLAAHSPWRAGSSHFGLVVPDAGRLWGELRTSGELRARSWGDELIAPPGQTRGMLAYMSDPDGLDIEIIEQRPAVAGQNGRPGRPAFLPGVNHVGLVVLDSQKALAFYGGLLGGKLVSAEAPWQQGDFFDSAVGAHGNVLRFYNESFPEAIAPALHMSLELVEFQNRREAPLPAHISDIGVGYVGFEVRHLDAFLERARAAGARVVSRGIATMRSGTREAMVRDPDVGGFVELFEHP